MFSFILCIWKEYEPMYFSTHVYIYRGKKDLETRCFPSPFVPSHSHLEEYESMCISTHVYIHLFSSHKFVSDLLTFNVEQIRTFRDIDSKVDKIIIKDIDKMHPMHKWLDRIIIHSISVFFFFFLSFA